MAPTLGLAPRTRTTRTILITLAATTILHTVTVRMVALVPPLVVYMRLALMVAVRMDIRSTITSMGVIREAEAAVLMGRAASLIRPNLVRSI